MNFSHMLSAAVLALMAASAAAKPVSQQGRSCHLPGAEEGLRCITLPLPLDYASKGGPTLNLHVTVAPAFREAARPDPLFVLAGGPGQAGSDVLAIITQTFRRARATRDIVLIDQRGTGLSGKLDCDTKQFNEDTMSEADLLTAARACIAAVKQPFAAYGTASAARDIEQVRLALGYDKINLWGASYGTRLAQAYARAYPGAVRSLILDGVVAPDQIIPAAGRDGQAALDLVFRQCAENAPCQAAYPNLRQEFDELSARVAAGAVKLELPDPRTARPLKLTMTSDRFLGAVHNILYNALDARRLPYLIHSAYQGRWEPFVARRNLASDYSPDGPVAQLMHLAVVCAEDWPRLTPALQADDATALTAPLAKHIGTMCGMVPVAPAPAPATTPIPQPVLLLSGELDPVTPPRRAVAAARYLPQHQHLVVTYAGHGISQLGCAPRLLREFLDKPEQPLKADCLKDIPAPTFQLGNAGPQP
ncbi:alpha/beta fold hydrolase [Massilia sp. CF038]|uniref:alpha/beta fold hydrolase n=1 Tax=Massilia sp. CF038 TaxID=1881045 RepID=UPI00091D648B|nr:alpha/beta fold hydrolase [Massilia sp. CF038]SHH28655.1 Pimeloyl-ACP methyl ester carboxylesterase [Massilia sp. CF038]